MDIVKSLNDYTQTTRDALFMDFLEESLPSLSCVEHIKNSEFILENSKPLNDFAIYTTASSIVEAKRLACRN